MVSRNRIGGRSEISILVVSALILLVGLSTFTLLKYRSAVTLLLEERERGAERWAAFLRPPLDGGGVPEAEELRRQLPGEAWVTVFDDQGRPVSSTNPTPLATPPLLAGFVSGNAFFERDGRRYRLQVDLPARTLRSRQRSLEVLTPVVVGIDLAVLILLMVYLQRILAPIGRFVDKAREIRGDRDGDDLDLLVQTFEKALEALSEAQRSKTESADPSDEAEGTAGDEMRALESALAESLESGVVLCDREGAVLALNSVAVGVLEVEETSPGTPAAEVLAEHPELFELVRRAVTEQVPIRREECRIRTSRGVRTLGLTAHPLRRDGGEVRGNLLLFADLTEVQQRLEEERLSDNLEQLGELSAGVAHEMRNGLATLGGYLTLIDRAPNEEMVEEYLAEIRSETRHLHRVLEDFLAFARPGSARLETVDLAGILHRVAQDPAVADTEVRVMIELPSGSLAEVQADHALLGRALGNLVHNAAAAQRENGCAEPIELHLSLAAPDRGDAGATPGEPASDEARLLVSIFDRGPGVPQHLRDRLFEPFVTGRSDGVGLGLALARRIVLLHRGNLLLRDRENGGTVAEVSLPAGKTVT